MKSPGPRVIYPFWPGYSLSACVPAEPDSASPGKKDCRSVGSRRKVASCGPSGHKMDLENKPSKLGDATGCY